MTLKFLHQLRLGATIVDAWQKHLETRKHPAAGQWFSDDPAGKGGLFGNLFGSLFGGSSGGASLAGGGGSLFSAPGFAGGTDFAPGGMAWVGEEGPELVNLPRGAQVIPAHESARMGMTLNQTINVMPGATRETAEQAARRAGAEARKGLARTG